MGTYFTCWPLYTSLITCKLITWLPIVRTVCGSDDDVLKTRFFLPPNPRAGTMFDCSSNSELVFLNISSTMGKGIDTICDCSAVIAMLHVIAWLVCSQLVVDVESPLDSRFVSSLVWHVNRSSAFSFLMVLFDNNLLQAQTYLYEKKAEIWLSPMTKAPTPTEMSKGAKWQHKQRHKKFDYIAVADGQLE